MGEWLKQNYSNKNKFVALFQPEGNVGYREIKFNYPTRPDTTILDSLNLYIPHGKTVALVGPSGCGKSTAIQLLQRFYDPDSGKVTIDDINLKNIKIASLRSRLGIVSQEPNLFDRTIEENIAYGDNQRLVNSPEIIEAAKNANIHSFVSSLPLVSCDSCSESSIYADFLG